LTSGIFLGSLLFTCLQLRFSGQTFTFTTTLSMLVPYSFAALTYALDAVDWVPSPLLKCDRKIAARWGLWLALSPLTLVVLESYRKQFPVISVTTNVAMMSATVLLSVSCSPKYVALTGTASVAIIGHFCLSAYHLSIAMAKRRKLANSNVPVSRSSSSLQRVLNSNNAFSDLNKIVNDECRMQLKSVSAVFQMILSLRCGLQLFCCMGAVSSTFEALLCAPIDFLLLGQLSLSLFIVEDQKTSKMFKYLIHADQADTATIKYFFRFICHELVPPLKTLTGITMELTSESESIFSASTAGGGGDQVAQYDTMRRHLDLSLECCKNMHKVVEDIKAFVAVADGDLSVRIRGRDSLDLKNEVRAAANHYAEKAAARGITLVLAIDSLLPDILLGSRVNLKTAVNILIGTAIDSCDAGGEVLVVLNCRHGAPRASDFAQIHFAVHEKSAASVLGDLGGAPSPSRQKPGQDPSPMQLQRHARETEKVLSHRAAQRIISLEGGELTTSTLPDGKQIVSFDINLSVKFPQRQSNMPLNAEVLTSPNSYTRDNFSGVEVGEDGIAFASSAPARGSILSGSSSLSLKALVNLESDTDWFPVSTAIAKQSSSAPLAGSAAVVMLPGAAPVSPPVSTTSTAPASASASIPRSVSSGVFSSSNLSSGSLGDLSSVQGQDLGLGKTNVDFRSNTILVVDDASTNRKMCMRFVAKLGINVEMAEDGEQALSMVFNNPAWRSVGPEETIPATHWYKAILLDNEMPKMTGEQTVRELRNREYGGVVIGVTGYAMSEDVERFVTAGCDEVLPKPLDIKRLMSIISAPKKEK